MPTGYTAYIEDGEITNGKEFLLKCARAFGVCFDMKEDSLDVDIPAKFEPDTYYKEQLEEAYKSLEKCKAMTIEEAQNIVDIEYEEEQKRHTEAIIKNKEINNRYMRIRDEIDKWTPPTPEHSNLKEFALEQIDISIIYDREDYHQKELVKPKRTAEEYIATMLKMTNENIEYYLKKWNEEVKRTDERNKWINDLRESLE